jgi:hypothetical protein
MTIDHETLRLMSVDEIKKIPVEELLKFDDEVYADVLTFFQLNALSEEQVAALAIKFDGY